MQKTTTLIILILVLIALSPAWAVPTGSDVEYIPYPRNLGIGVINPDTKLEIAGSTLNNRDGVPVYRNVAAYTNNATQTGTLKITLPKSWSSTSLQIKINGFASEDQPSGSSPLLGPGISPSPGKGACELLIGGRNDSIDLPLCPFGPVIPGAVCTNNPAEVGTTLSWTNTSAMATGILPFDTVRLAHDGTKNVILLGTTTSTWKTPQIQVTEVATGGNNILGWGDGWSVSFISDESSLNSIKTPSLDVVLPAGASVNNLTATSTINGTTLIGDIIKVNQSLTAPYIVTPFVNGGFKGNGSELTKVNAASITGTLPNTVVSAADPWILVHSENFDTTPTGWSNNTTTSCAGHKRLGGFNVLSTASVFKSFDLSAYPHSHVKLKFDYYSLDSWDYNKALAKIDGTIAWSSGILISYDGLREQSRSVFANCGSGGFSTDATYGKDEILTGEAILEHSANPLKVEFDATVDELPDNESFGIDNLEIWVKSTAVAPATLANRTNVPATTSSNTVDNQFRSPSLIFTSPLIGYKFYSRGTATAGSVVNAKTADGGATWQQDRGALADATPGGPITWYDQWTPGNSTGSKIYFLNSTTNLIYREFDSVTDTVVATCTIRATGGLTSTTRYAVTQASDGVKYIGVLDTTAGSRGVFRCSGNCGVGTAYPTVADNTAASANWVNIAAPIPTAIDDDGDDIILRPLQGGRILMIAWDSAANDIFYSFYSGTGTDWSALTLLDNTADIAIGSLQSVWGAVTERSSGDVYLVFNSLLENATGQLKTYVFSNSTNTWTAKANVTSGSGLHADIAIDENTGNLYSVFGRGVAALQHFEAYRSTDHGTSWQIMGEVNVNDDKSYARLDLNQSSPHLTGAFLKNNLGTDAMTFIKLNP